ARSPIRGGRRWPRRSAPARAAPHVRDALARRRRRPPRHPGAPRPLEPRDDAALRARVDRAFDEGLRRRAPARARREAPHLVKPTAKLKVMGGRLARSAFAAAAAGLVCSLIDAGFADHWYARDATSSPYLDIFADAGCIAPLCLVIGLFAGLVAIAIDPVR